MLSRLFKLGMASLFPWLVLLINDNPGGALVALIMQASIIGWVPASIWAWRTLQKPTVASQKEAHKPSSPDNV
jgi:hypothetical protein